MAGTPDEVVFSIDPTDDTKRITWGQLRANSDSDFRLRCLKVRIEDLLLFQSGQLLKPGSYAPYPLAVLTLIGLGALGEIFCGDTVAAAASDHNKSIFCQIAKRLAQQFSRPLTKTFKEAFAERWGVDKPRDGALVLYTFFRNSFIHGYYGRAVFLTGDETPDVAFRDDGCVLLHPWWFYERFVDLTQDLLAEMLKEQPNGQLKRNALKYISNLLDEPKDGKPASQNLKRLISARADLLDAFDAFQLFMQNWDNPLAPHLFGSMVIAYGRPFTENSGIGNLLSDYPGFPDYEDEEMNVRHLRLIDLRNKFAAHSSTEGTRIVIVPPGIKNPIGGNSSERWDYNIGKRKFPDPRYAEWLMVAIETLAKKIDADIHKLLPVEFDGKETSIFELDTGHSAHSWTAPKE